MRTDNSTGLPLVHPLAGSRPSAVLRTLIRHGGVAPAHWHRLAIILASCFLRWPACLADDLRTAMRAPLLDVAPAPTFIVGHWRSGTTLLHSLMANDPRFIYPTLLEAVSPYDFYPTPISRLFRNRLLGLFPPTRPMDAIPFSGDLPQEEEAAMAAMAVPSFFNCFYFPSRLQETFDTEVLFEGISNDEVDRWVDRYRYYLNKLMVLRGGGALLLKNPANSARIEQILRIFPDARFIHITRCPREVFISTRKLYRTLLHTVSLQTYDEELATDLVIRNYPRIMDRLFSGWAMIPEKNRTVVRYEDVVADPTCALESIYGALGLDTFHELKPRMDTFLENNPIVVPAYGPGMLEEGFPFERWRPYVRKLGYDDEPRQNGGHS